MISCIHSDLIWPVEIYYVINSINANIFWQTHDKKAPYVDEITPGVILASGGCGYAAKSCDEIGRIAANLCTIGEWTCKNIARSDMKIKWRSIKS